MTFPTIAFRSAEPQDDAAIAALHTASWRSANRGLLPDSNLDALIEHQHARLWQERLRQPRADRRFVVLAEQDGALIGFACVLLLVEPGWGACLDNLHVQPELKGRGIGRDLFARSADWVVQSAPIWPLHLWVLEANLPARRFYDRYRGEVAERTTKPMADGVVAAVLRYVWRDLDQLQVDLKQSSGKDQVSSTDDTD
jgi:GNAT superfamily N-acetyltransferase